MKTNKINKDVILETIVKEAQIIARKHDLYDQVKSINEELKKLYESGPLVSTFGFKTPTDGLNKSVTGFEATPNISYIAQLEKEMGEENETINEIENIKLENEKLRKELEELKSASKSSETKV